MNNQNLRHLSLPELQLMIQESNLNDIHAYVGRNVGIVNRIHPAIMRKVVSNPVQLDEMRLLVIRKGWSKVTANLMPMQVEAGELVFLATNSTVQIHEYAPDAEGMGITMTNEVFLLAMGGQVPPSLNGHLRHFKLKVNDEEMDFLANLINTLYTVRRQKNHNSHIFLHLVAAFWWYVDSIYERQSEESATNYDRNQQLFANFIVLVNQHARREHNLSFYAEKLFLSQRYMSTLVKQVSGRSAKEWVDEALVTAIKVELRHSDKSLKQIADEMNMPNASFFCKFFKNHTGLTPMEYRNSLDANSR